MATIGTLVPTISRTAASDAFDVIDPLRRARAVQREQMASTGPAARSPASNASRIVAKASRAIVAEAGRGRKRRHDLDAEGVTGRNHAAEVIAHATMVLQDRRALLPFQRLEVFNAGHSWA